MRGREVRGELVSAIDYGIEEEEEFYKLYIPSLDYATSDARRLRFLEYPESAAVEQRSLASFTPTLRCSSLFFLPSS